MGYWVKVVVVLVTSLCLTLAAVLVVGARLALLMSPGVGALILATVGALAVCVLLPLFADWRVTKAFRRIESTASSSALQTLAIANGLLLGLAIWLAPGQVRQGLEQRSEWFLLASPSRPGPFARRVTQVLGWSDRGRVQVGRVPAATPFVSPVTSSPPPVPSASSRPVIVDRATTRADSSSTDDSVNSTGPKAVFRKRADSVVVVLTRVALPEDALLSQLYRSLGVAYMEGQGSGFFVSADGLIATNHHVIAGARSVAIRLRDGRTVTQATLVADSPEHDLALLQIDEKGRLPVDIAKTEPQVGDRAIAIGSPSGLEYTLTDGIVSALRKQDRTQMLQMQTTVAPGSSGGPLFDERGELIGVNTASHGAGLNMAVRTEHLQALMGTRRLNKPYAVFEQKVELTELEYQGFSPSVTERAILREVFTLLATAADGCIQELPDNAFLERTVSVSKQPTDTGTTQSNLGDVAEKCLSQATWMAGMSIRLQLSQDGEDTNGAQRSITAVMKGIGKNDASTSRKLRLTVTLSR